jgi:hypothetical protein
MTDTKTETAPSWQPEFEGQRPPFEPGNTAAQVSGYMSPRAVAVRAAALLAAKLEELPHLGNAYNRETTEAWAFAQARVELAREHEAIKGMFDPATGEERVALEDRVGAAENRAAAARDRIGLGPVAAAKVARDQNAAIALGQGHDLLAVRMAAGQAAIAARDAAQAATTGDEQHDDETEA